MQGGGPPGAGAPPNGGPPWGQPPPHASGWSQQSPHAHGPAPGRPPAGGYGAPPAYGHPSQQAFGPGYGPGLTGHVVPGYGLTTCPRCNSAHLSRPSFTWWGGFVGPKLLNHTVCNGCGLGFNSKTGKENGTAIAIYVGVVCVLAFAVGILQVVAR
jgi:hypothetical protein